MHHHIEWTLFSDKVPVTHLCLVCVSSVACFFVYSPIIFKLEVQFFPFYFVSQKNEFMLPLPDQNDRKKAQQLQQRQQASKQASKQTNKKHNVVIGVLHVLRISALN